MAINEKKYGYYKHLRDVRPAYVRLAEWLSKPSHAFSLFLMSLVVAPVASTTRE
jgi:hypothetical protein